MDTPENSEKISLNIFLKFPKRSLNPNEFSNILVEGHHRPSTLGKLIRHLHLPVANCTACRQDAKPCVGCQFWKKLLTTQDYNSEMIWKDGSWNERCYCVLYTWHLTKKSVVEIPAVDFMNMKQLGSLLYSRSCTENIHGARKSCVCAAQSLERSSDRGKGRSVRGYLDLQHYVGYTHYLLRIPTLPL